MVVADFPPPAMFGVDGRKFPEWRPGQVEAFQRILDSPNRIVAAGLPTGWGKSLIGYVSGKVAGRCVYLTSRRGLQTQIMADFQAHNVWGQSNYKCKTNPDLTVADGPCHTGMKCELKDGGCDYYDAVNIAALPTTKFTVTNYAFYIRRLLRPDSDGDGLGPVDLLVLDEAHRLLDELSSALSIQLRRTDVEPHGIPWPPDRWSKADAEDADKWKGWAVNTALPAITSAIARQAADNNAQAKLSSAAARATRRLQNTQTALREMGKVVGEWAVGIHWKTKDMNFSPLWPGEYLQRALLGTAKKVVFMSATMNIKMLNMLGLGEDDYDFYEQGSLFPIVDRPILYDLAVPNMRFSATPSDWTTWLSRLDNLIDARLDKRMIVHCHSYQRKEYLMTRSRHRGRMMGHTAADATIVAQQFRMSPPGTILVSQSMTEGWDFPGEDCEVQFIVKIPFPDSRDAVIKARNKIDKDYSSYLAMQTMVQAAGRGIRYNGDRCETIILDGASKWFMWKCAPFAPMWFNNSVKRVPSGLPTPLIKL